MSRKTSVRRTESSGNQSSTKVEETSPRQNSESSKTLSTPEIWNQARIQTRGGKLFAAMQDYLRDAGWQQDDDGYWSAPNNAFSRNENHPQLVSVRYLGMWEPNAVDVQLRWEALSRAITMNDEKYVSGRKKKEEK